VVVIELKLWYY